MIFTPSSIEKIRCGSKTQTRRVPSGGGDPCRYRVGATYSVQPGRTKRGVARIYVTGIRREFLGDISEDDIRAEGFTRLGDFGAAWAQLHGHFDLDTVVDVIDFKLVSDA